MRVTCKWCSKEFDYDAGYYYHEHACHAQDVRRRLAENAAARKGWQEDLEVLLKKNAKERKALQAELEQAEYVGD